jgi:hypothetical protein
VDERTGRPANYATAHDLHPSWGERVCGAGVRLGSPVRGAAERVPGDAHEQDATGAELGNTEVLAAKERVADKPAG